MPLPPATRVAAFLSNRAGWNAPTAHDCRRRFLFLGRPDLMNVTIVTMLASVHKTAGEGVTWPQGF